MKACEEDKAFPTMSVEELPNDIILLLLDSLSTKVIYMTKVILKSSFFKI